MRKIFSLLLIFAILTALSGCNSRIYPRETDMEYMVSSIGFDKNGKTVSVFAEIIVVNSGDSEKGATPQIFKASGETAKTALYNLHSTLSKPLMLKHCGLLILGSGIDNKSISEIFEICLENKNITQAIKVVATKSAKELLSVKPVSNIALGYEISEALKQNSEYTGIIYKNRFYEIEAKRESKTNSFALPFFSVEEEKYQIDGLKVYSFDLATTAFNNEDAAIFSIMSNSFKAGEIKSGTQSFKLKLKSVKYDFEYSSKKLSVKIKITLQGDKDAIKQVGIKINEMPPQKTDIYSIADRIYREKPKLWTEIEDNYKEIFEDSSISFEVVEY